MSAGETPRTRKPREASVAFTPQGEPVSVIHSSAVSDYKSELVSMIEKAPVDVERGRMLDLLERAMARIDLDSEAAYDLYRDIAAALRERGRLTDSPSAPVSLERGE